MSTNRSARDIERSLAEADELVQRINADFLNEMEEAHRLARLQFTQPRNTAGKEEKGNGIE